MNSIQKAVQKARGVVWLVLILDTLTDLTLRTFPISSRRQRMTVSIRLRKNLKIA